MLIWFLTILLSSAKRDLNILFAVPWTYIILKKKIITVPLVFFMNRIFTSDLTVQNTVYCMEASASSEQDKTTLWSEQSNSVTLEL